MEYFHSHLIHYCVFYVLIFLPSGYLASPHSANIPLQQQLQHANEKSGFNDGDKYKLQQVLLIC